jgi:C1A family cysteine protease
MYSDRRRLAILVFAGLVLLVLLIDWDNSRVATEDYELIENDAHLKNLFTRFQDQYSRSYDDKTEEAKRFSIFKDNLQKVFDMNEAAQKAGKTVKYGVTKFSDLTPEEFKSIYLTYGQVKDTSNETKEQRQLRMAGQVDRFDPTTNCPACHRFPSLASYTASNIPTDFDWRDYGAVTGVKNQAECGSCWTFSTTGDIEGSWYLAGNDLTSLSEQQLVACDTFINAGCNGGLQELAFMFIQRIGGIVSEADYPYEKMNMYTDTVTSPNCNASVVNPDHFVAEINGWQYVATSADDEDILALSLIKAGPLALAMNADGMQYYSSGIDQPDDCSPNELDHAVLLVGYGVEDGLGYWTIKNSWDTEWGEDGYYRIARGANLCGIAEDVLHSVIYNDDV